MNTTLTGLAIPPYFFKAMSPELIILIAAVVVAWLVFNWLIKVVKASLSTAVTIAVIVLILQLVFGIGPQELWEQIKALPETIVNTFSNSSPNR
ncbi:MAG: hypothetical protein ACOC0N_06790 [Chroococcales cyanobacterium]